MMDLEIELQNYFNDKYSRVWVQTSRLNSICVTLFSINRNRGYRIITEQNFNTVTFDSVKNLIIKYEGN
jgi:hypothetical protein